MIFPQEPSSRAETILEIMNSSDSLITTWTQICTLHLAGHSGDKVYCDAVLASLRVKDPFVRETAVWALEKLKPDNLKMHLEIVKDDPCENVRNQRVLVLKSISN